MSSIDGYHDGVSKGDSKTSGAPGVVVVPEDPAAPSEDVSSKKQSISDLFTIVSSLYTPVKLAELCPKQ